MSKKTMTMQCGGIKNYRVGSYISGYGNIVYKIIRVHHADSDSGTVHGVELSVNERIVYELKNMRLWLKHQAWYKIKKAFKFKKSIDKRK